MTNQLGFVRDPVSATYWPFEGSPILGGNTLELKPSVDLRPFSSPVHRQTHTQSCVAQAVVKALEITSIKAFGPTRHTDLSRLFVYYLAREQMVPSQVGVDSGTNVSTAMDVLRKFGVPREEHWPWDLERLYTPPSLKSRRAAWAHRISAYYRISSTGQDRVVAVKTALSLGYPVVFGTALGINWKTYYSFNPFKPKSLDDPGEITGWHATVLVGYDEEGDFIGENSWGSTWGSKGFYYMKPGVVASDILSHDFWVMQGAWT